MKSITWIHELIHPAIQTPSNNSPTDSSACSLNNNPPSYSSILNHSPRGRKEGKKYFLQLYSVRHMVKSHSDSKRGNLLLLGIFYIYHPAGWTVHTTAFVHRSAVEHWLEWKIAQWVPPWGIDPTTYHTMSRFCIHTQHTSLCHPYTNIHLQTSWPSHPPFQTSIQSSIHTNHSSKDIDQLIHHPTHLSKHQSSHPYTPTIHLKT